MKDSNNSLYSLEVILKVLCINEQDLNFLKKRGVIHEASEGKYNLIPSVQSYIQFLQKEAFKNKQQERNFELKNIIMERKIKNMDTVDGGLDDFT